MGATQSTVQETSLKTSKGTLKGLEYRDSTTNEPVYSRYSRIPYAQPPTGQLRFRKPQPLPSSQSLNGDFTSFGPICPQPQYNHTAARLDNANAAPQPEDTQSEDCLYLNIWVPSESTTTKRPASGWPVQIHLHGGWLQVGDANQHADSDPFDLFRDTTPRIIVAPTYRLNLFGFLAGSQLSSTNPPQENGNFGLWDQRLAIEWVYDNISHFNGDNSLISVGGLSAGAHSAFLQLYYDTFMLGPSDRRIIKQVYLWSNAMAIQPKLASSESTTAQFAELCSVLSIPQGSGAEQLVALRAVDEKTLLSAISRLKAHTFRSVTDDAFVPSTFLKSIHDGSLAAKLRQNGVRLVLGEVQDEKLLYKLVNPPSSLEGLKVQLANYYPPNVCDTLLNLSDVYSVPQDDGSEESKGAFGDVFAEMVADMQVHSSIRGLAKSLLTGQNAMEKGSVVRYRVCWRAKGLDEWIEPKVGVCHGGDGPIWWGGGWRAGYTEQDRKIAQEFLRPFGEWLYGREWEGGNGEADVLDRIVTGEGDVKTGVKDDLWKGKLRTWDAVAKVL